MESHTPSSSAQSNWVTCCKQIQDQRQIADQHTSGPNPHEALLDGTRCANVFGKRQHYENPRQTKWLDGHLSQGNCRQGRVVTGWSQKLTSRGTPPVRIERKQSVRAAPMWESRCRITALKASAWRRKLETAQCGNPDTESVPRQDLEKEVGN